MTIEEKARAYDKAIERAKKEFDWPVNKSIIERVFPELQESEDERIRKTLIHIVKGACDKYGIKYKGDEIAEEKLLAYLEKQKEQKPVEWKPQWWSEEDEAKIHFLKNLIQYQVRDEDYCFGHNGKDYVSKQEAISMLKSLRPSWKPSEEQMETLEYYLHVLNCNEHKEILFGLYEQLKKLM